ncbi:MAG: DUF2637 domain-containing protein [Micromonosporaceae bacterium]
MIQYLRSLTAYQRTRLTTTLIMVVAAFVSYGHQRELLATWGCDRVAQYAVPLTVDLLAITCNIALHLPELARRGFWTSLIVLILAVAVSGSANYIAGGTPGAKYANLWTVLAYLLSEFVTAAVKVRAREKDPVRVAAGKKAAASRKRTTKSTPTRKPRTPKLPATDAEAYRMLALAGAAPVSPAPAGR